MALLSVAALGLLESNTTTWIAIGVLIVQLGLFGLLAVRRAGLPW